MRLTNAIRDSIILKESNKKFNKELDRIADEIKKLVELDAAASIPKEINDAIKKYPELKDSGWISYTLKVNLNLASGNSKTEAISNPLPFQRNRYGIEIKASKKLESLYEKEKNLKEQSAVFRSELRKIVYGFTSVKPLIKAMPEMEIYFKETNSNMALIPYEAINKIRKELVRP